MTTDIEELYQHVESTDGLDRMLSEMRDTKASAFLELLVWKLAEFSGTSDFPDDVSGLLFEYSGAG